MIVRPVRGRLLMIRQPDHAALSARIMGAWRADGLPAHAARSAILLATHEHDNGWLEEDARPTVDPGSGRPYDFVGVPDEVKHAIWPRAVGRFAEDRPDVAALIAQHALTVHERHQHHPRWAPFFETMARLRHDLLERVREGLVDQGTTRPDSFAGFLSQYRFVFLGDLLSLVFCNGWTDPLEGEGYRVVLEGETLKIAPDPFEGSPVRLEVPARDIPDRPYESDEDLRRELAGAVRVTIAGTAVGTAKR